MKLNDALVAEAGKVATLLTALKPYKAFSGRNNIDRLCAVLEEDLDKVCGRLMEGRTDKVEDA